MPPVKPFVPRLTKSLMPLSSDFTTSSSSPVRSSNTCDYQEIYKLSIQCQSLRVTVLFTGVSTAARGAASLASTSAPFSIGGTEPTEAEAATVVSGTWDAGRTADGLAPKTLPFPAQIGVCGAGEEITAFGEKGEAANGDPVPANAANPVARFGGGDGDGGGVTGANGT